MKNISPIFTLLVCALLLVYCGQQMDKDKVLTEGPYFPRKTTQTEEAEQMEALLVGKLIFQNNCFQIQGEDQDIRVTPIWPAGFDYRLMPDSTFAILNASGNEVARTNSGIRLSGGEVWDAKGLDGQLEGGVPKLLLSCPAPYWIVGEEVKVMIQEKELSPKVENELETWFNFYAPHIEDWRLSAFKINDQWQLDSLPAVPSTDIYPIANRPDNWLIYAPGRQLNLDLYARDIMVEEQSNGTKRVFGLSPDSEVAIENLNLRIRQRLLFCGTPCRFEAGFWEDEQTVVIAGLHQDDEQLFHPTIWRVKLDKMTVQEYTYPTPLPDPFPYNYVQEEVFGDR